MWPDRVSNPIPLTYESGALPTALRGPASGMERPVTGADRICFTLEKKSMRLVEY